MIAIIHKTSSAVVALIEMDISPEEVDNDVIIARWCHAQGLGKDSHFRFRVDDCPITPYTEILEYGKPSPLPAPIRILPS